ncbi:MAG: hypothetical protein HY674_07875 [Chloroflexi bacterium]|nr:hypothetical protein [Chloroflexota bacterium]
MNSTFESLVDRIRAFSTEEREELRFILERSLIEGRREQMLKSYRESRDEMKKARLKFSSNMAQLKKALTES